MDLPAKIAFLINGKNGTSISLNTKIKEVFEGFDIGIFYSSEDERFLTVPKKLLYNGYRVFIILGGDGTVNEVLNGIAQNETHFTKDNEAIWSNIRIGIIPYGTANDFSRNLEDCSLEAIKLNFINGFNSKIDYGIAQYIDKSGALRNRYFLNVLNIGLGGMAAFKATSLKKWWGKLSYMIAVALSFLSYKKKNMTWHIEGHSFTRKIFNLSIANGRYAGNGLAIAPDAAINDGRLDITVVGNVTILDYLLQLRNLITCTKIRHKEVSYQSCSTVITFQNAPQERPWDCDGEYIQGELLRVTIDPHSIRLLHHIKR